MRALLHQATRAAASDVPILISGESGTGKEVLAQIIHESSPRKAKAFIPVNCAAIPKELAEAELFGHTKGAFTGSTCERPGIFEMAHGGTVFLDELADMEVILQAKLLRVLQSGEVRRLGSSVFSRYDFRIIATLNRKPEDCVRDKILREDLYYRLSTIELLIPPLSQRREDIGPIAAAVLEGTEKAFSSSAVDALFFAPWPGNVRQLINAVRRAIVFSDGHLIQPGDLGLLAENRRQAETLPLLVQKENETVLHVLEKCGGNMSAAARMLGIGRQTLYNKVRAMSEAQPNDDTLPQP